MRFLKTIARSARGMAVAGAVTLAPAAATATEIVVTHYGAGMYGIPYSVALEKGWFKEAGIDVKGILTSKGGGTSVRNLMAGGTVYGEVALTAAISAIKEGFPIKIVNAGTIGRNGFWVIREGDKIETPADLKGKTIAFSRPRSSSEAQVISFLNLHKVPLSDVKMLAAGDIAPGITALVNKKADIALATEPAYTMSLRNGMKLQPIRWVDRDVPPPMQTVGIATVENIEKKGDEIRRIIEARRRGVKFIYDNLAETAKLSSKDMRLDPDIVESMIKNVSLVSERWWSEGAFDRQAMETVIDDMVKAGQIERPVNLDEMIDRRFLPADLKTGS